MLQKIISIIFLIQTMCKRVLFLNYALTFHQYHKNYSEKNGYISWMLCLFCLIISVEGITELLKSNFERSKCKWRRQSHAFPKKRYFFEYFPLHWSSDGALAKLAFMWIFVCYIFGFCWAHKIVSLVVTATGLEPTTT